MQLGNEVLALGEDYFGPGACFPHLSDFPLVLGFSHGINSVAPP
jgi:hypothetical protein